MDEDVVGFDYFGIFFDTEEEFREVGGNVVASTPHDRNGFNLRGNGYLRNRVHLHAIDPSDPELEEVIAEKVEDFIYGMKGLP